MKIAVTITKTIQTGFDSYKDVHTTKVFNEDAPIYIIMDWAKSIDKNITFGLLTISEIVE